MITFVTVQSDKTIAFPAPLNSEARPNEAFNPLATPAETPGASGQSPEITISASTPSGGHNFTDQDPEARLIDVMDETWALLLDFSVNDPFLPSTFCYAQASGFLLKRAGTNDEDGFLPLAVSILHDQSDKESLLLEVLGMYRKLATLARIRHITDSVHGILPWHVAAAERAHAAVKTSMCYGDG